MRSLADHFVFGLQGRGGAPIIHNRLALAAAHSFPLHIRAPWCTLHTVMYAKPIPRPFLPIRHSFPIAPHRLNNEIVITMLHFHLHFTSLQMCSHNCRRHTYGRTAMLPSASFLPLPPPATTITLVFLYYCHCMSHLPLSPHGRDVENARRS